jgi:hypothetical protein
MFCSALVLFYSIKTTTIKIILFVFCHPVHSINNITMKRDPGVSGTLFIFAHQNVPGHAVLSWIPAQRPE